MPKKYKPVLLTPRLASLLLVRHGVWGPTLAPRSGRTQLDPVGATSSWAGRRQGRPSASARPTPSRRPAPDAGWDGLLAASSVGTLQPSSRAAAVAFERPGGPSSAAGSPRCPRLQPGGAQPELLVPELGGGQDADLCALSRPHDPEHVDSRKEGASRLHLQPQWPRHDDPLLLRQRGHLSERHQPAVSVPRTLPPSTNPRKVCFSAVPFPSILASKRGRNCTLRAWRSRGVRRGGILGWRWCR